MNRAMEIYFALEGINHGNRQCEEKYALDEVLDTSETSKGTRRPGDRASRRKATIKAKRQLKEIEPLTMSVRRTRNGGVIKRGDTYSWLPEWKAMDKRNRRHNGKEICWKYSDADDRAINKAWTEYYHDIEDRWIDEDDYDSICNPWGYTEEEKRKIDTNHLHGDFNHTATEMIYEDYHNPRYLDDEYEYFGFDPYQSTIDDREEAWDTIADLTKEIARYKDFLGEFNLNTLYERWLADNNS